MSSSNSDTNSDTNSASESGSESASESGSEVNDDTIKTSKLTQSDVDTQLEDSKTKSVHNRKGKNTSKTNLSDSEGNSASEGSNSSANEGSNSDSDDNHSDSDTDDNHSDDNHSDTDTDDNHSDTDDENENEGSDSDTSANEGSDSDTDDENTILKKKAKKVDTFKLKENFIDDILDIFETLYGNELGRKVIRKSGLSELISIYTKNVEGNVEQTGPVKGSSTVSKLMKNKPKAFMSLTLSNSTAIESSRIKDSNKIGSIFRNKTMYIGDKLSMSGIEVCPSPISWGSRNVSSKINKLGNFFTHTATGKTSNSNTRMTIKYIKYLKQKKCVIFTGAITGRSKLIILLSYLASNGLLSRTVIDAGSLSSEIFDSIRKNDVKVKKFKAKDAKGMFGSKTIISKRNNDTNNSSSNSDSNSSSNSDNSSDSNSDNSSDSNSNSDSNSDNSSDSNSDSGTSKIASRKKSKHNKKNKSSKSSKKPKSSPNNSKKSSPNNSSNSDSDNGNSSDSDNGNSSEESSDF